MSEELDLIDRNELYNQIRLYLNRHSLGETAAWTTLTVGEIEDSSYSRITITITGDENTRDQFVSQLRKLFNVKKVQVLEAGNTISRELLLIKVKNSPEIRPEIMAATEVYRGKIIDYAADVMSVEVTGEPV